MKSLKALAFLCLFSVSAFCTHTITGTLKQASGAVPIGARLHFELRNCGPGIPLVPSVPGAIVNRVQEFKANPTTGVASGTIYGNDEISCGGTFNSQWEVTTYQDATTHSNPQLYTITGNWNLATAIPDSAPVPPSPPVYWVKRSGDTMTGELVLYGDPVASMAAASKHYVDSTVVSTTEGVNSALGGKLNVSGGTMTGPLTLVGDPTSPLHAATKQYVDTLTSSFTQNALPLVGGTLTGPLYLSHDPAGPTEAATKSYVDAIVPSGTNAALLQGVAVDTTSPTDTEVLTYDQASNKWKPGPGSALTTGQRSIKYAIDYNWTRSPSDDLSSAGAKTVNLTSCPYGVFGVWPGTSDPQVFYVRVAGTGTPEAVKVTGGTCAGDGNAGTLQFTTANAHSAGYTVSSANEGAYEAITAASVTITSGNNYAYKQQGAWVVIEPGLHQWYAPLSIIANNTNLYWNGAVAKCNFDPGQYGGCLVIGRNDNYTATSNVTVYSPRLMPTVAGSVGSMILVYGQKTRLFNVQSMIGPANGGGNYGNWGHWVTVVGDQAFLLDGLDTSSNPNSLSCSASFCPSVIYAPGPFSGHGSWGTAGDNAAVGWLKNMQVAPTCQGNGVDWQSGNGVHISDSVIQGYAQFGIRGGLAGGYSQVSVDSVHEEVGACTNPLGALGQAGIIMNGERLYVQGGEGPAANPPRFAYTGSTEYHYWFVPRNATGKIANMQYAGYALTNGSGNISVQFYAPTNLDNFDLLRKTYTAGDYSAPYGTGNFAVATNVSAATACTNNVCTVTDTQAALSSYTVSQTINWWPYLAFGVGQIVLGNGGDTTAATSAARATLELNDLNQASLTQNNVLGGASPSFNSTNCQGLVGGPAIASCLSSNFQATILRATDLAAGATTDNRKGRLNFLGGYGPNHFITVVDSNAAKTIGSLGSQRPGNDATDTYIGCDAAAPNCAPNSQLGQLALGAPVAIDQYIGNVGDNANWKERLTASGKTFSVNVTAPWLNVTSGYQVNGQMGATGACIVSNGSGGSTWGTCWGGAPTYALDNFNRADGAPANWTNRNGTLAISGNKLIESSLGGDSRAQAYYSGRTFTADQYAQATITGVNGYVGLALRVSDAAYTLYAAIGSGSNTYIQKFVNGTGSTVASGSTTWAANDVMRLEVRGTNPAVLTLFKNGTVVLTGTDSTSPITSGYAGAQISSVSSSLDNWDGGDLSVTQTPLTTKGDLYTFDGTYPGRLPVGLSDGLCLQTNSGESTGLKWDACSAAGTNATQLQARNVASTAPADLNLLGWNAGSSQWEPKTITAPMLPTHSHAEADVTNLTTDLGLKAPLVSPALTGVPTAPTAGTGTNNTQIATTAFVLSNSYSNVQSSGVDQTKRGTLNFVNGLTATDVSSKTQIAPTYGTTANTFAQGNDSRIVGAEQTANKGIANGYASLGATGRVPAAQLGSGTPDATKVLYGDNSWGSVLASPTGTYWNATTGYQVNGSYGSNGQCLTSTGSGSAWATCPGGASGTVFGRTLPVTAQTGDYTVSQVTGAAADSAVVHNNGTDNITGTKNFNGPVNFTDSVSFAQFSMTTPFSLTGTGQDQSAAPSGQSRIYFNSTGKLFVSENGGAVAEVAKVGAGTFISTLNGSSQTTQSFATPGTSGTAPNWSTNTGTGVHTLNIPMAFTADVTAGLISKSDYDIFNGKQDALSFSGTGTDALKGTFTSLQVNDVPMWDGSNWVNGQVAGGPGSTYTNLTQVGDNTLAEANSTNAQTFYVYGTHDGASPPVNYERLAIVASTSGDSIGTEASGNGVVRALNFRVGGSNRWVIAAGTPYNFFPQANGSYDIGDSGHQVRDLYLSRNLVLGGTTYSSLASASTLPNAGSCTNQVVTALVNGSAPTCSSLTPSYVTGANLQGNGTKFLMNTGSMTSGNLVSVDVNGNAVDSGTALTSVATLTGGFLPKAQGGAGASMASVTFPSSGTIATTAAVPAAGTCTNQAVTGHSAGAAPTCTTLTSAYVDTSIAKTGVDVNTSNQVTATHLAAALPVNQGGTGTTSTLTGLVRGSASAMTAAELSGAVSTSGSNVTTLASKYYTREFHFKIWGTGTSNVLQDADDELSIFRNEIAAIHITKVVCESDTGTPTIQLQKDDGSPANMFSSAITCNTTPSGTDGTSGILTSFVSGEDAVAAGDRIDYLTVTAGGSAHWVAVTVVYTID